jgi:trigger factor
MDKTDNVSAVLNVSIEENDYKPEVDKKLKEIARNANIPGFRKGHVPAGMIQKRFGKQATSDAINDTVYNAVVNYIRDNKLAVLGQPIPVDVKELDLDNQKDFQFQYLLALVPEINVELNKEVQLPYYKINVTDEMVNEQSDKFRERFGAQVPGETVEEKALVKGSIMELDDEGNVKSDETAIQMINGIVAPMYFKDKAEADKFIGKAVNDKVVFNPWNSCEGNVAELSSMLGIDKDKAANAKGDFEMTIAEIIVVRPAELNQEYFDNVLGKDAATDEQQYLAGVKAMIERDLEQNSKFMFRNSVEKYMTEKYGNMEIPAETLKKWLVVSNENITNENVDAEFEKMLPSLKWQLIKERMASICEIKIEESDLTEYAKMIARQQFAQYGMTNVPEETLEEYAKRILADKEYRPRLIEEVGDTKLFNAIEAKVTLDEKIVSVDEFKELAQKL